MTSKYDFIGYIGTITSSGTQERILIDQNIRYDESASVQWGVFNGRGTLGALYTYSYSTERTFPVEFVVTDYDGTGDSIQNAMKLLHKWRQPKVNTNAQIPEITAPPPVLDFYYAGFTTGPIKVVLKSYRITHNADEAWYGTSQSDASPVTITISVELAEVGITMYNKAGGTAVYGF